MINDMQMEPKVHVNSFCCIQSAERRPRIETCPSLPLALLLSCQSTPHILLQLSNRSVHRNVGIDMRVYHNQIVMSLVT
jgi:hypothetical protein